MKTRMYTIAILSVIVWHLAYGQPPAHLWWVIDAGGDQSAANGFSAAVSVGQPTAQKLSAPGFNVEGGFIPGLGAFPSLSMTLGISVESDWNLLSVPLAVSDHRKRVLFPAAISSAFRYNGTYVQADVLENDLGYWMKFPEENTMQIIGTRIVRDTIDVNAKWNIIGSLSDPVPITSIIPFHPQLFYLTSTVSQVEADIIQKIP